MRGGEDRSESLFRYVRLEERVLSDHPLRPIRALADEVPAGLNGHFETLYSGLGRPSIPPEMLLRATLLQAFFSVRSERMLMERIDDNLLFWWFVGLKLDAGGTRRCSRTTVTGCWKRMSPALSCRACWHCAR